jgi:hypothetical protein
MCYEMRSALFSTAQTNRMQYFSSHRYRTCVALALSRGQLKRDGTCTENRFRLSAKRTSPFKSAGASFQSTTGSRGVRISGSNAGYMMFRGSVKSTGYPLHSPVSPLHSPSRASPCAITFQLESNNYSQVQSLLAPTVCWGRIRKCCPLWDLG